MGVTTISLAGKKNWVLTKSLPKSEGMETFASFEDVERELKPEGAVIRYWRWRGLCPNLIKMSEIYITEVPLTISDGDAFFPTYKKDLKWLKPWFKIKISHYADGKEFSSKALKVNKPKGL